MIHQLSTYISRIYFPVFVHSVLENEFTVLRLTNSCGRVVVNLQVVVNLIE